MINSARKYHKNKYLDNAMATNPNILNILLLDDAREKVTQAKVCHENQQHTQKGFLLGSATVIIDTLRDHSDQNVLNCDQYYNNIDNALRLVIDIGSIDLLDRIISNLIQIRNLMEAMTNETDAIQFAANYANLNNISDY